MLPIQHVWVVPRRLLLLVLGAGTILFGQTPTPVINGIVNGATFKLSSDPAKPTIGPSSLASILGSNLADTGYVATTSPLPTTLGGVIVVANGQQLPLTYVGPGQINFQAPGQSGTFDAQVVRNSVASNTMRFYVGTEGPGIFAYADGDMQSVAAARLGDNSTIGMGNAAHFTGSTTDLKSYLQVFFTGGAAPLDGTVLPPGAAAPVDRLLPVEQPVFKLNNVAIPSQNILFTGLAPGYAGLWQANLFLGQRNSGVPTLTICYGSVCSDPVKVPGAATTNYVVGTITPLEGGLANIVGKAITATNNTNFPLETTGDYLVDVPAGAAMIAFLTTGGANRDWSKKLGVIGPTVLGLTQPFPIQYDTATTMDYHPDVIVTDFASTNPRPETLTWSPSSNPVEVYNMLNWLNIYTLLNGPCHDSLTGRWRDQDIPIPFYINPANVSAANMTTLLQTLSEIKDRNGNPLIKIVNTDPLPQGHGVEVVWQQPPGTNADIGGEFNGLAATPCVNYTQGRIYLSPTLSTNEIKVAGKHETGHALGFFVHSPSTKDVMYYHAAASEYSVEEQGSINDLFGLKISTDVSLSTPPGAIDFTKTLNIAAGSAALYNARLKAATTADSEIPEQFRPVFSDGRDGYVFRIRCGLGPIPASKGEGVARHRASDR